MRREWKRVKERKKEREKVRKRASKFGKFGKPHRERPKACHKKWERKSVTEKVGPRVNPQIFKSKKCKELN